MTEEELKSRTRTTQILLPIMFALTYFSVIILIINLLKRIYRFLL